VHWLGRAIQTHRIHHAADNRTAGLGCTITDKAVSITSKEKE